MRLHVECTSVQDREVIRVLNVDRDLVAVLHVGSNSGKVLDYWYAELAQLFGRTDTAELQELRCVERATCKNNFLRGKSLTRFSGCFTTERTGSV